MAERIEQFPVDLLEEAELFRSLGAPERAYLIGSMYRRVLERGDVLVNQDIPADEVYLIAAGLVSVVRFDATGTATEVAQLGRGALVGELSLLTGNRPNATVAAMMETEVWALSHQHFQALLSQSIALALNVNRLLSAKIAATNQRLTPQRAAHLTAILGDRNDAGTRHFAADLAASIARHTRDRVLLIDCHPTDHSPLCDLPTWGVAVDELLNNQFQIAKHTAPVDPEGSLCGARLLRYSASPFNAAEPGVLLSLATRLRGLYRHILFDIPAEHTALLSGVLPLSDNVVVVVPRIRLHRAHALLRHSMLTGVGERGLLAVTGWSGQPRMGEIWPIEEEMGWKIGALIDGEAPQAGIDRVARAVARLRIGIAWSGGGPRGYAGSGIVRALEKLNVPLDLFAGTSAGALGAAVVGLSMNSEEANLRMRRVLPYLERTTRTYLPIFTISRHSLMSERWWNGLIRTLLDDHTFADLMLPFAAVALDLHSGRQHVFTRGPLWEAIRASSSLPVLAPPMMIQGRAYVDGGVVNNLPLDVLQQMGADILIGIDFTGAEKEVEWGRPNKRPDMLSTLRRSIDVTRNTVAVRTIPLADALIRPILHEAATYDMSVMDTFIAEGERATLAALPELRASIPWLD